MPDHKGLPVLSFRSQSDWISWLAAYGGGNPGIWLKFAKKTSGIASVSKVQAIESALAYGWIDGQLDKFDDQFWLTRFTPRGPNSNWSQVNRDTARRLIDAGQMSPSGMLQVDRAKANGRWHSAYAPQSRAEVPGDLAEALSANPKAANFFGSLTGPNRYAVLYRIADAKTQKTRAARIEKFLAMLERGETICPSKSN